jgi:two-component system, OmpR family, phosphate regulon sensor histidine kinase PhoR
MKRPVRSWWQPRRQEKQDAELAELAATAEALAGDGAAADGQTRPAGSGSEIGRIARSLERLQARLAEATTERDRLREILASRNELVANVSHELKTPLTAIRGSAETLEDGALAKPEVARRFTGRILEQCGRLEALLRDLLTLSRLESRPEPPDREPLDLTGVARHAIEVLAPRAVERNVDLRLATAAAPRVAGHRGELERLFLNLIENAIKYNRPGGEVEIRLGSDGPHAVIEVVDDGIGVPDDALERIFERFYRVDKGRARRQGGTGLGLAIVKHVARHHGGSVEVESRLGEGSTFRVRLPAVDA